MARNKSLTHEYMKNIAIGNELSSIRVNLENIKKKNKKSVTRTQQLTMAKRNLSSTATKPKAPTTNTNTGFTYSIFCYNPPMSKKHPNPLKGRGAFSNPDNRYAEHGRELIDDGWGSLEQMPESVTTTVTKDSSRTIINYIDSPDVPMDRSINPYRGCEHGCVYCFARPTHAWLGLSPGLDFESKLFYKPNAAELLQKELAKRNYRCQPISLGINTDAYQPIERRLGITRQVLEVLAEHHHPVTIVTKSSLIERDIDILAEMAANNLASVAISIPTLNRDLAKKLEPRAATPQRRMETVANLQRAGVPVAVFIAPLIPVLTDSELETIIEQAHQNGAGSAGYILLRLPHEVKTMFQEWLQAHEPLKAEHVMNRMRDCRGGKEYEAQFGKRMTGTGIFAQLIEQRYRSVMKKLSFPGIPELDCNQFRPPTSTTGQMSLF